jgi:diguanylate cyclase
VTQGEADTRGMQIYGDVLARLEALQQTPVGAVIHDQINQVIDQHRLGSARIDQTYGVLLHMLIDACARGPQAEPVKRLTADLIRHRAGLRQDEEEEPVAVATAAPADRVGYPEPAPVDATAAEEGSPASPARVRSERSFWSPASGKNGEHPTPKADRRINSSYRLHLDRKRDEIERLQETLARSVAEAVLQNREFGTLLETELQALRGAKGAEEIEQLRRILVGGLEELIQGQRALGSKLRRTDDYLRLVRSDSDRLRDELNKVRLLSLTDEFTGLPNRRAFMRRLQDEISRVRRYGAPLAVALLDLDKFKNVNDAYGHAAGDAVLRCYAENVLTVLRHHDMVARYGGEEFAVLLPNTTREGAQAALEKALARAHELCCNHEGKSLALPAFSAGLTLYLPGESPTSVIDRADRALYCAKNNGRNRVEFEPGVPVSALETGTNQGGGP